MSNVEIPAGISVGEMEEFTEILESSGFYIEDFQYDASRGVASLTFDLEEGKQEEFQNLVVSVASGGSINSSEYGDDVELVDPKKDSRFSEIMAVLNNERGETSFNTLGAITSFGLGVLVVSGSTMYMMANPGDPGVGEIVAAFATILAAVPVAVGGFGITVNVQEKISDFLFKRKYT